MDHQEVPSDQQEQLDAVLDAALDELDDDDDDDDDGDGDDQKAVVDTTQAATQPKQETPLKDEPKLATSRTVAGPEPPPFDMGSFDDVMKQIFQAGETGGDPEAALDSFMKQLQSQLTSELGVQEPPESRECESKPASGKSAKASEKRGTLPAKASCQENDVDRTISKLLNDMATANSQDDAEEITGEEEEMFRDMMKEFEKMGGGFDQDAVVDSMMQQLLSKDIMYEPMKQVTEKFPSWLEEKKDILPEEEYNNRLQQYECFRKLIRVYENEPENVEKLMQLMQDVQEYGQPPTEIVKDIAPDLELDEDGVPKLDSMGGFGDNEECVVM